MNHTCGERLHPVWSEMGQNENKKAEISSCAYLPRILSLVVLLTPAWVCSPDQLLVIVFKLLFHIKLIKLL